VKVAIRDLFVKECQKRPRMIRYMGSFVYEGMGIGPCLGAEEGTHFYL